MENSAFELLATCAIPEINSKATRYRHLKTGAELLSLENDDENKVFGITFRTPPEDSTGVAHIMEHSVLCGSRKYPVKEPFIELVKGSLKTFVNALTFPDKTCYPCASQNLQDFYNLIDVYMDAVLHPILAPHTLDQEGWHYELTNVEDPLIYKGVVYNEMKGGYSDPDRMLSIKVSEALFPDNPYGFDSGGDPREIPDLTYKQFADFHRKYYHPSNARLFFYGDDPPETRLKKVASYLRGFDAVAINSEISLQPPFSEPTFRKHSYPGGSDLANGLKGRFVVGWTLKENNDPQDNLAFSILNHILIGTPGSPLRKALIDSGLGGNLSGGGLNSYLRQLTFSTGLKEILPEDHERVAEIIFETLHRLVDEGIDRETILASLNTVEFYLREMNTGPYPRGLLLMFTALNTWLHGGDPLASLAFDEALSQINSRLQSGERVFEGLIQRYFLNNKHRTSILLVPDPVLGAQVDADERARLKGIRSKMSEADLKRLVEKTRVLRKIQGTPDTQDALASLPVLKLKDLERQVRKISLDIIERSNTQVLYHDLFTNGVAYLDLGFDLQVLFPEELPYVPLIGRALLEMGTYTQNFVRLSQRIGQSTGGIRSNLFISAIHGSKEVATRLFLRAKVMPDKSAALFTILQEVLLSTDYDNQERFRQIVREEIAIQEAGIVPRGHTFVGKRLRSHFNQADWVVEQTSGVQYLFFLRKLAEEVDHDWVSVLRTLEQIRDRLINRQAMIVNVTLDEKNWVKFRLGLDEFLLGLPNRQPNYPQWNISGTPRPEGLVVPAQVNYVGKAADLYRLGYELHGSINVINKYLRTTWLWDKIRVQGGAYGGMCGFNHHSGIYTLSSYRDPNLFESLQIFDETAAFLRQGELHKEEIIKSIIGAIGDLDAYLLPDAKGYSSMVRFLVKEDDQGRQQFRDEVIGTSVQDFRRFANILDGIRASQAVAVMGAREALEEANRRHEDYFQLAQVL